MPPQALACRVPWRLSRLPLLKHALLANKPLCDIPFPPLPSPHSLQGDVKEGVGAAQAKAEDVAGDASRAAKDAADELKP